MSRVALFAACMAASLSGCASTPAWRHASLAGLDAERQHRIDHGQCTQQAYAAMPPSVPPPSSPVPSAYAVQGQARTTAPSMPPSTTTYSAQVRPQAQLPDIVGNSRAAAEVGAAAQARRDIYAGCMAERGWERAPR